MTTPPINYFMGKYRFLSNFYPAVIVMGGMKYPTVEHAYQAAKASDVATRDMIRTRPTPGAAKAAGRAIKLRLNWVKVKEKVMKDLVREKFKDPVLKQMLMETGNAELVEGNTWGDTEWGMVKQDGIWCGNNKLGKILMDIRHEFLPPAQKRSILV